MKKICLRVFTVSAFILFANACNKSGSDGTPITVENLAGTYALQGLVWNYLGANINVYDSLDACEKDNLTTLGSDLSLQFIDAGTVCSPSEDGFGSWYLINDSLFSVSDGDTTGAEIQSFNGKTLVLSSVPEAGIKATTTRAKQ